MMSPEELCCWVALPCTHLVYIAKSQLNAGRRHVVSVTSMHIHAQSVCECADFSTNHIEDPKCIA